MKSHFLSFLVCPECKQDLHLQDAVEEQGEIKSGILVCPAEHRFPIRDFVPRFVESDAYVSSFSYEWTTHQVTQLDRFTKRAATDPESSAAIFRKKTGFTPEVLKEQTILDVGCGVGRFLDIAREDANMVVGIDLSFAIDVSMKNMGFQPNVHLVQADVNKLPFRSQSFDLAYSIGVLHHTPNTRQAFQSVVPYIRPGGKFAIYVYPKIAFLSSVSNFYRRLTIHLPSRVLYTLCYLAIPYYYLTRLPLLGMGFHLLWPISHRKDPRWRLLDTFDWYSPRYQWKHDWPEVYTWFKEAGFHSMECHPYGVCMSGTKG